MHQYDLPALTFSVDLKREELINKLPIVPHQVFDGKMVDVEKQKVGLLHIIRFILI